MLMLVDRYKLTLRRLNQVQWRGRCPLPSHTSKDDDTFAVNTAKNVWSCQSGSCAEARGEKKREGHGPKKGGDVFDFVRFMESVSLRGAGELLASWFTVSGEFPAEAPAPEPANDAVNLPLSFELKDIQHVHPFLTFRGFEEEECEYLGVGFYPGKGSMRNRVVFPIHDAGGQLIAYAGRCVEYPLTSDDPAHVAPPCEGMERWKVPQGFLRGQVLYNHHRIEGDSVIVVESFWGVLACVRAGIMNAVALMSNFATHQQVALLAKYAKVTVLLDGDEPGRDGMKDLLTRLVTASVESIEARMLRAGAQPDSLTPDELRGVLGVESIPYGLVLVEDVA